MLIQGGASRDHLLRAFREAGNAVLLGTGSFWEGIDVKGEALSVVIIDKLPFAAPDDPLLKARLAAIREQGGNPFFDEQVPQAVIALKQGVGPADPRRNRLWRRHALRYSARDQRLRPSVHHQPAADAAHARARGRAGVPAREARVTGLRVLAIDTSTEACSAALLWSDGEVRVRFVVTERGHADLILPMIDGLLAEAGCRLADLDGLAFGRGPGGFTGLRIAAGVIQGLAYGAGLHVAPVSSLAAVAFLATSSFRSSPSGPSWPSGPSCPSCPSPASSSATTRA